MNVLILTPERVGSTLLQRLLTIYMLNKGFNEPVINIHELSDGFKKYYNPVLKMEILEANVDSTSWDSKPSLEEIVTQLESVNHYKVGRLSPHYINQRKDSISNQLNIYKYLNNNFYIISAQRNNLFEYALSWEIYAHSKIFNVSDINTKINKFSNIYQNKISACKESFVTHLDRYKEYIIWTNQYFNVQSYFNYDLHIHNMEDYILNLDFMSKHNNSWKDMFGQDFNTWNLCHQLLPNIAIRSKTDNCDKELIVFNNAVEWDLLKGKDWPISPDHYDEQKDNLPLPIKEEILKSIQNISLNLTNIEYDFLKDNIKNYKSTIDQLSKLISDGFLFDTIPIKLQTLAEKKLIVKNFKDCVTWYNEWVDKNNFGSYQTKEDLQLISEFNNGYLEILMLQK